MPRHSLKTGLSFSITSGVITTLGLIVGLHAWTGSKTVVFGGIVTIAVADAFSDALGIHISEESESKHNAKEIWEATVSTFASKFLFASTFVIPVLLLSLSTAITVSVAWGFFILGVLSFSLAKEQGISPWKVVAEHLVIASVVIATTHYVGDWISSAFG